MNNNSPPDENTKAIKFLLKGNFINYKLNKKGKKLKTLIIGGTEYRYNPNRPISKKLENKINRINNTNKYRAYQQKEREATNTVLKHAIKKKATITEERSAFKAYANAYTISNIHLKGLNGLSYFVFSI